MTKKDFEGLSNYDIVLSVIEKNNPETITSNKTIAKRYELCEIINRIEFTFENYGVINFFIDYGDEISDLKRLLSLLEEFNEVEIIQTIKRTINFYEENKEQFEYLRNAPQDFEQVYESLHTTYINLDKPISGSDYSVPLHLAIENLAGYIKDNPTEFFLN
ncbi:hypothetical protein [Reichenbachiella sp. MSK19-1]|uniref:hypothetical protein n=1 Tax=Reichenbachiella sp. MSK19-1 TaxID=1897631 RepID=UPI000E6BF249|nr:hypothetical protein [Reichenbachiella sp. MSK19-1]RJE75231.1 hypothetical protein BGP76_19215 [Reichenbachiella sp. MSK19-1]